MAHDDDQFEPESGAHGGGGQGHSGRVENEPLYEHIDRQIVKIHWEYPKLGTEGIRHHLDELGLRASPVHIADVLEKDRVRQRTLEIHQNNPKLWTKESVERFPLKVLRPATSMSPTC